MTVALVTGASRGIGRAIALALAGAGHHVALVARSADSLAALARDITDDRGRRALAIPADLRDPDSVAEVLATCAEQLGPPGIVVHNAGTAPSARLEASDDRLLDEVLDLHVRVPFRLVRAALPHLRAGPAGSVVFLGSTAGLRGYPFTAAYSAAKHGTVGLARALAAEWAREPALRAFVVCPGFVDTLITRDAARAIAARGRKSEQEALAAFAAMNRIGRLHDVDEVARAVLALITDRPEGTVLDLDQSDPQLEP